MVDAGFRFMTASYESCSVSIVALDVFWSTKPKKPVAVPDPWEPNARPPAESINWRKPPELLEPGSAPYHFEVEAPVQPSPYINQPCTPEEPVTSVDTSVMVELVKDCVSVAPARMAVPVIVWKSCV